MVGAGPDDRAGRHPEPSHLDGPGLRALAGTPLTARDKAEVPLLLNGYVFWEAWFYVEVELAAGGDGISIQDATQQFGALIRAVVDPARFPALRRAVDSGIFDDADGPGYADSTSACPSCSTGSRRGCAGGPSTGDGPRPDALSP